jgi:Fe-S-cluster containining protein
MWRELCDEVGILQERFDGAIRRWIDGYAEQGGHIHCGRGCSACCSLTVNCTFTEAGRAAAVITDHQAAAVAAHVAHLRKILPRAENLTGWLRLHRREAGFCPFLDHEGACCVYAVRPFSCRALLATRESRWCGADFAELSSEEKRGFVESLDRSVVAFPMHYAAATRELGEELEQRSAMAFMARFSFSLYGSFPVLVHLEREHGLSSLLPRGADAVRRLLEREGLSHSFLVAIQD